MKERDLSETLLHQIELKRQLMIQSGVENGLRSKKTLHLSKQVDQLINKFNEYYKINLAVSIQNNRLK